MCVYTHMYKWKSSCRCNNGSLAVCMCSSGKHNYLHAIYNCDYHSKSNHIITKIDKNKNLKLREKKRSNNRASKLSYIYLTKCNKNKFAFTHKGFLISLSWEKITNVHTHTYIHTIIQSTDEKIYIDYLDWIAEPKSNYITLFFFFFCPIFSISIKLKLIERWERERKKTKQQ